MVAFSSINFFGNNLGIFTAAGIPAIVITPVTIADFTSEGVYSIGGGGGCLGTHTGMVEFATTEFGEVDKISVPWADTPPGVVCYYDLESKPLDVISGDTEGASERAGELPDLEHIGVPIQPATPDLTSQVSEILGYEPDVILFSAQGADCWNLVGALGAAGWTPDQIPLVLSGACIDFDAMAEAGDLSNGIYFVGSSGSLLNEIDTIEDPKDAIEAEVYQTKAAEYGLDETELRKGFGTQGFVAMMSLWEIASQIVVNGDELSSESIQAAYAATDGDHLFGSTPLSCSTAPEPYVAVCNGEVSATQWDGETLVPIRLRFSGVDLVAGTELQPGP
jgi:branched-chain amino acid transport system substrate-binding protein